MKQTEEERCAQTAQINTEVVETEATEELAATEATEGVVKSTKKRVAAIVCACALMIVAGVGVAFASGAFTDGEEAEEAVEEEILEEEDDATVGVVAFSIIAEGWSEDSSPFIAYVEGITTADASPVRFCHAIWADGSTDTVELEPGTYIITYISAINADGSIYDVIGIDTEIIVEADGAITVAEAFELIAAEDVSSEDLEDILDEISYAVANGDETLTDEAGAAVVEIAEANAANNTDADTEATEEVEEETETVSSSSSSAGSATNSSSSSSSSSKSSSGSSTSNSSSSSSNKSSSSSSSTSSGSASSSSSSNKSSGSSSNSSSSSSSGSTSSSGSSSNSSNEHEHSWVYHQAVSEERSICSVCGEDISGNTTAHGKAHAVAGEGGGFYSALITTQAAYYSCSCGATKSA